jgi:hypothetical protein
MTTTPDNAADGQTRKVPAVACTDLLAPVTEDKTPTLEVAIRNAVGWIRTLSPLYPKMSDWLLDMAEDPKWRRHLATTDQMDAVFVKSIEQWNEVGRPETEWLTEQQVAEMLQCHQ